MSEPRKIGLGAPSFYAFLVAQFLGAANDNAFKITIVMFVLATVAKESTQVLYSSLATALLPIPFLLFSPFAGYLADRFPKHRVLFGAKLPEVLAMAFAVFAFRLESLPFLFAVFFLMATQSAFFSPAKYGILPEVFEDRHLSAANGRLELATNLAILTGSVAGVFVYSLFASDLGGAGLTYLAVAVIGTVAIAFAPRAPAGNPQARLAWNVLSSAREDLREVRRSPVLFYTILGIAYFGFLGSVFLAILPVFGKNALALSEQKSAILLGILSIGIAAGSLLAARLSRNHVELGLVPLGSLILSLFAFDLAFFSAGGAVRISDVPLRAIVDLLGLGIAGGLYIIPLNALLQQRSPEGMKGRLIAFSNVLTFTAVLVAAAVPWSLSAIFGVSTGGVIVAVSLVTVVGTLTVMNLLPDFFVRLVFWLVTNTAYRVRSVGEENIPKQGVLFVANHVSWVDFLMIGAACDRMIRFLMYRGYYEWRMLNWFFRRMHTIPVAAGDPPHKKEESLAIARREIEAGHATCIFAEGSISRTGNLLKFKRGLEQIARGVDCPIVPIYLDGIWGSLFSFERGRFFFKRPKRFRAAVTVVFGAPLPSTATALEVRNRIQELSVEAFRRHKSGQRPLGVEFLRTAIRSWRRPFLSDSSGRELAFGEALVESLALRDVLFGSSRNGDERIGILLPPGIDGALANLATALAGKVAVNLDLGADAGRLRLLTGSVGVRRLVTSRALASERSLPEIETVFIEDALAAAATKTPGPAQRWRLRLLPFRFAARSLIEEIGDDVDRPAAILFSYPSDAPDRPAGALVSHHNLLSNLESLRQVFATNADDSVLGVVPFSNALGFAATIWLPAIAGFRVTYCADPGSPGLGAQCKARRVTLLPASPELLASIGRSVGADELSHLRFAAVGGGRLADEDHEAFAAKFGIEPVEGYGCPECAPIVSLNVPDVEEGKTRQVGTRAGTSGHPLPGISVRVVDPAGAPLPPGTPGLLEIKGANVFTGYANDPERTKRVLADGWFRTGERARLDAEGFLTLLGASEA